MQMPKKINAAVAKEFLFLHGEKIALGVCAFLALSFGLVSMIGAMSAGTDKSGTPYPVAIKKRARRRSAVASAPPSPRSCLPTPRRN